MSIAGKETSSAPADIDTATDDYARRFAGPVGQWMLSKQNAIVLSFVADQPGGSVLDVGGGHGQLAQPLVDVGHPVTVHGSDASCAHRLKPLIESGAVTFVESDMFALPFDDASVDVVTCIRLLPHCPQWRELVAELCRVARKTVIVDFPAWRSVNVFSGLLFPLKKGAEGNTRTFRLFTHGEVMREFRRHGFEITDKRGQFVFPMALHRILKCVPASKLLEGIPAALGAARLFGSPVLTRAVRIADK